MSAGPAPVLRAFSSRLHLLGPARLIKTGSGCRRGRVAKFSQFLRIVSGARGRGHVGVNGALIGAIETRYGVANRTVHVGHGIGYALATVAGLSPSRNSTRNAARCKFPSSAL